MKVKWNRCDGMETGGKGRDDGWRGMLKGKGSRERERARREKRSEGNVRDQSEINQAWKISPN